MMYPVDGVEDTYQHNSDGVSTQTDRPRPHTLQHRSSSPKSVTAGGPPVLTVSILLAVCVGALLYVGISNNSFHGRSGQLKQSGGASIPLSQYVDSFEDGTKTTGRLDGANGVDQDEGTVRLFKRSHPHGVNLNLNYRQDLDNTEDIFQEHVGARHGIHERDQTRAVPARSQDNPHVTASRSPAHSRLSGNTPGSRYPGGDGDVLGEEAVGYEDGLPGDAWESWIDYDDGGAGKPGRVGPLAAEEEEGEGWGSWEDHDDAGFDQRERDAGDRLGVGAARADIDRWQ